MGFESSIAEGFYSVPGRVRTHQVRTVNIDQSELREGVSRTRRYVLSHHEPSEYYRCFTLDAFGQRLHICARCAGIYPGILLGLVAYVIAPAEFSSTVLVAVLPAPAIVDWFITSLTDRRGYNALRATTGSFLGYGWGLGIALTVSESNLYVPLIGLGYGLVAVVLLYLDAEN